MHPRVPITPRSWRAAVATQGLPAAHARLYWCQEATGRARDDSSARARSPCRTHFHVQTLRGAPTNAASESRARAPALPREFCAFSSAARPSLLVCAGPAARHDHSSRGYAALENASALNQRNWVNNSDDDPSTPILYLVHPRCAKHSFRGESVILFFHAGRNVQSGPRSCPRTSGS